MPGLNRLVFMSVALLWVAVSAPNAFSADLPNGESPAPLSGMSDNELDTQRGGEIVPISSATLNATLEENTISGTSITGNNSVGGSAFTDANGFFTVIQNSGNQVIIQDSTIINLTVE